MTLVWRESNICKNCDSAKELHKRCHTQTDDLRLNCPNIVGDGNLPQEWIGNQYFVPVRVATEESVMAERKELAKKLNKAIKEVDSVPLGMGCPHCEVMNNIEKTAKALGMMREVVRGLEKRTELDSSGGSKSLGFQTEGE